MTHTDHELNRIHTLAKAQAHTLRDEAIAEFWRGANTLVTDTGHSAYRSAQRLAHRLARRQRAATAAVSPTCKGA